jgi:hypothetical protein
MELDRRDLVRFRAAIRRCVAGRPRGLAPPVTLQQNKGGVTLSVVLEETALALHLPGAGGATECLVIPFSTLAALDGSGGGIVAFESTENGRVRCRWQDRGEAKELDSEAVPPESQPALPSLGKLHSVNASLLTALHACGQTANREQSGRPALTRLQLRGQAGEIAGTDGRQLLLWGGFVLPFREDLLIPAVPIFGGRELAGEQEVRIGRTAKHVAVAAGPWMVWLAVDAESKYPDVGSVIPVPSGKLVIDDADAAAVLQDLQKRPNSQDETAPIVLDLGSRSAVRWPEGTPGRKKPLLLSRSAFTGPATAVTLLPQYVVRALSLGFREMHTASGDSPVLFRDGHRRYLVANFGPASTPAMAPADTRALPAPQPSGPQPQHQEESMTTENNGSPIADSSPADELLDPLTEAEALRVALMEVVRRTGRLISSLRRFQRQRRALQSAWTSLKDLRLGPRE